MGCSPDFSFFVVNAKHIIKEKIQFGGFKNVLKAAVKSDSTIFCCKLHFIVIMFLDFCQLGFLWVFFFSFFVIVIQELFRSNRGHIVPSYGKHTKN